MKTIKLIIIFALVILLANAETKAQSAKTDTIKIKTSSVCEMCKDKIETALAYEKGIKKSSLDVDSKTITVIYRTDKTSPEKIKKAISLAGYDADEVKADPKAFKELEECCKDASKCEEKKK